MVRRIHSFPIKTASISLATRQIHRTTSIACFAFVRYTIPTAAEMLFTQPVGSRTATGAFSRINAIITRKLCTGFETTLFVTICKQFIAGLYGGKMCSCRLYHFDNSGCRRPLNTCGNMWLRANIPTTCPGLRIYCSRRRRL